MEKDKHLKINLCLFKSITKEDWVSIKKFLKLPTQLTQLATKILSHQGLMFKIPIMGRRMSDLLRRKWNLLKENKNLLMESLQLQTIETSQKLQKSNKELSTNPLQFSNNLRTELTFSMKSIQWVLLVEMILSSRWQ